MGLVSIIITSSLLGEIYLPFNPSDITMEIGASIVARKIERNLDVFKRDYNSYQTNESNFLNCETVEDRKIVTIIDDDESFEGILLDFNDDNGYLLVKSDNEIIDIKNTGKSPFEGITADEYFYSVYGIYSYRIADEIAVIDHPYDSSILEQPMQRRHYAGQEGNVSGYGLIYNTKAYVEDCYGTNVTLVKKASLPMDRFDQYDLSCYIFDNSSEANCGLVSVYHVLQYLSDTFWTNLPQFSNRCEFYDPYIYEPSVYFKYFNLCGEAIKERVVKQEWNIVSHWPVLYKELRMLCASRYNKIDDLNIWNSCWLLENMASRYGYEVDAKCEILYKLFLNSANSRLDNGMPLLFSVLWDTCYGDHTMAVCGYEKYKIETEMNINSGKYKVKGYALLYELADGWHTNFDNTFTVRSIPWSIDHQEGEAFKTFYDMTMSYTIGSLVFLNEVEEAL